MLRPLWERPTRKARRVRVEVATKSRNRKLNFHLRFQSEISGSRIEIQRIVLFQDFLIALLPGWAEFEVRLASVVVLQALDVVFPQVTTTLDLNKDQLFRPYVFNPMGSSDG